MAADGGSDKGWLEVDRFRSRGDGKSEFVRARIPWAEVVPLDASGKDAARLTAVFASPRVKFLELPANLSQPDHPAPRHENPPQTQPVDRKQPERRPHCQREPRLHQQDHRGEQPAAGRQKCPEAHQQIGHRLIRSRQERCRFSVGTHPPAMR